jgi:hypothetical protein
MKFRETSARFRKFQSNGPYYLRGHLQQKAQKKAQEVTQVRPPFFVRQWKNAVEECGANNGESHLVKSGLTC